MKFLGIGKQKDVAAALPPAVTRQLLEVSVANMKQQKKEGRILEFYVVPGWFRTVVIMESQSAEDVFKSISAAPITNYMDIEIYPLADGFGLADSMIETLKQAEKMMPGVPK
jgi:muconolactone delta-isomerase